MMILRQRNDKKSQVFHQGQLLDAKKVERERRRYGGRNKLTMAGQVLGPLLNLRKFVVCTPEPPSLEMRE